MGAGCTSPEKAPISHARHSELNASHTLVTQDTEGGASLPPGSLLTDPECAANPLNTSAVAERSLHGNLDIEGDLQIPRLPGASEAAIAPAVPTATQALAPVSNHLVNPREDAANASVLEAPLFEAAQEVGRRELIEDDGNPEPTADVDEQADLGRGHRKRKPTSRLEAMDKGEEIASKKKRR